MSADRIRLVPAPPRCSGCFQQQPTMRHVDFEAAWDGPTLPALEGAVGVVGHHIDELILCESCITFAAKLLGLEDVTELIKARARLEETRDQLLEKVAALEEHSQHLRSAVSSGAEVQRVMRPRPIMPMPSTPAPAHAEQQAASSRRNAPAKPRAKRAPKSKPAKRQSAAAKAANAGGQK